MSLLDGLRGRNARNDQAERLRRAAEAEQDGLACLREGNLQRAVVEWRRCLDYRPEYPLAHGYLGLALYRLGELDQAQEALARAVQIAPDDEVLRRTYGMVLEAQGRLNDAAMQYQAAIAAAPDSARAHASLGSLALKRHDLVRAEMHIQRALQLDPNDPQALSELAEVYQRQDRPSDAIPLLQRALAIRPRSGVFHYKLGLLLMEVKQPQPACEELRAAHQALPNDAAVLAALARVLFALHHGTEAHQIYERAMREDPEQHARYLGDLAQILAEQDAIVDASSPAPRSGPMPMTNQPRTATARGRTGGDADAAPGAGAAIAALEAAIRAQPDDSRLRRDLSLAYLRAGRIEDAKAQAQLADELRAQRRARAATT